MTPEHVPARPDGELEFFNRAPVGYMLLDADYRILAVNRAWCLSLGYSATEVCGRGVDDFIGSEGVTFSGLAASASSGYLEQIPLRLVRKDGESVDVLLNADLSSSRIRCIYLDVSELRRLEAENRTTIATLQRALDEIRTLRGLLHVCSACKRVRNDRGDWEQLELYLRERTAVDFSHGLCPDCVRRLYPGFADQVLDKPR